MPDALMLAHLRDDLIRDEGLRLKPYRCTAGKLSIGVGRNLDDLGLSKDEALYLLGNDIARVCNELDKALPWWRGLAPARQRALANMAFQLGLPKLLGFKAMLASLKAGNFSQAAEHAKDSAWARQVPERAERIAKLIREG